MKNNIIQFDDQFINLDNVLKLSASFKAVEKVEGGNFVRTGQYHPSVCGIFVGKDEPFRMNYVDEVFENFQLAQNRAKEIIKNALTQL